MRETRARVSASGVAKLRQACSSTGAISKADATIARRCERAAARWSTQSR